MGSDDLALQRTFLAHERTLMAWIRTSTSLISFGFTIYKFFEYLLEAEKLSRSGRMFGPREFALSMIGIGVVVLMIAALQYRRALKLLEQTYGETYRSLASQLAIAISVVGFAFLILVLLRQ